MTPPTQTLAGPQLMTEIKETLGIVPHWFEHAPPEAAQHMWHLMRDLQLGESKIPNKYKELIGLGIAGATRCGYCTHFHTEAARLHGASEEEIAEANAMAGLTMAFSTYLNGMQVDKDRFRKEVGQIINNARKAMGH